MDDKMFKFITQQFSELSEKIDSYKNEVDKFKDKVYDRMDAVYKEVLAFRQEQAFHTVSHDRINEKLKDHEKRLEKMEQQTAVTHQIKK